ncbi:HAMP domain-containing protein [Pelagicoccus sp. SDUM812005]|uniref:HAMP domain-containing protein n=1 Tax=Pelagicoccus sp. SDUM812005 TaxID=3041257 RepID=UPI00280F3EE2|nr:HAMP domain-containing protein [Pelagicoccus sp. SDUM812005]MDQ8179726.1 HAMP domain-containing protein [Pelagicoccus sp. SDUM812005]
MNQLRIRLASSAALISQEIDADTLRDIRQPGDVEKFSYQETLEQLRAMRRSVDDIAFLYIMRKAPSGEVVFVIDTDESEEQALPGQVYQAATPQLREGFLRRSADEEITRDRWGAFFSGYSPVMNGDGEFLVGIDMRADEVRSKLDEIQAAALWGIGIALLLSWGIATWMSRHFKRPIDALLGQIQAVSAGNLDQRIEMRRDDEMDSLLNAINDMTSDLKRARDDNLRLAESLDDTFAEKDV